MPKVACASICSYLSRYLCSSLSLSLCLCCVQHKRRHRKWRIWVQVACGLMRKLLIWRTKASLSLPLSLLLHSLSLSPFAREMGTSGATFWPVQQGVYFMYSGNYQARLMAIKSNIQRTLKQQARQRQLAWCNMQRLQLVATASKDLQLRNLLAKR